MSNDEDHSMGVATESESVAAAEGPEGHPKHAFSSRFMTPLLMGAALNPINSSLIATALVPIAGAMHVPVGHTAILISSLYLTSAIAQPTLGRLSEEFGPRRVFLGGIAVILVGGLVGGLAKDVTTLVVARVLIGLGTSAGYPSAMLVIRRRATAVGLQSPPGGVLGGLAVTSAVTLAIGPTIGGLAVGWFSWRSVFLINVPVALIAFASALRWIAKDPDHVRIRSARDVADRVDLPGVLAFATAITALLVFLMGLPTMRWAALVVSVAAAVVLVLLELRAGNPFIDVRLMVSNGPLTRTYVRYALTLLGIYVMLYGFPQWAEGSHGMSPYRAGLVLIPMGVLSAITARIVSRMPRPRPSLIASSVFLVVGAVAELLLDKHSPVVAILGVTALFGFVAGFGNVTNQTVLYKEAPPDKVGTAAGLLRTFGYVGSIAAATITGFVFRHRVDDRGLHVAAVVLIVIGVVVLAMTVLDRQLGRGYVASEG
jgi:MFS family permease